MRQRDTSIGGPGRDFPSTSWTDLLDCRDPSDPDFRRRTSDIIHRYWKPVYHYIRAARGLSVEESKDLTQQFFTKLVEGRLLRGLEATRGSFRGFLKTSVRHFVDRAHRASRRPSLDLAPRAERTPEEIFDAEWTRATLREALDILKESLAFEGKERYFDLFHEYCVGTAEEASHPTYPDLARRFAVSEDDVRNHLRHARKRIREILRGLVRKYVGPAESVEEEISFLLPR